MKTNTNQSENISNVNHEIAGTRFAGARYVTVNKRKYYFVSDLTPAFGTAFLGKLSEAPIIRRIAHEGNSQSRRLVGAADLKHTLDNMRKTCTKKASQANSCARSIKKHSVKATAVSCKTACTKAAKNKNK